MTDYAHPENLVGTEWVARHAGEPNVRVVEVDVETSAYDEGHIPGAIAWAWKTQLADTVRRDILPQPAFEALLQESGIGNDTTVILYGDNNNWFAAWALWQLKIYGHKDVRLMNGGRKKWIAEGRELTTEVPVVARTRYRAASPDLSLRAFLPQAQAASSGRAAALVDVRSPAEFTGEILRSAGPARNLPARRPHPRRPQHSLGQGLQGGWHVPALRRTEGSLRRRGNRRLAAGNRLLPHRGTLQPHLVRAALPARSARRDQLRRLLDRVGQPGRRTRRAWRDCGRAGLNNAAGRIRRTPRRGRGLGGQSRLLPARGRLSLPGR